MVPSKDVAVKNRSDLATFIRESNLIESVDDKVQDKMCYNVFLKLYDAMFYRPLHYTDILTAQAVICAHSFVEPDMSVYLGAFRDERIVVGIGVRRMQDRAIVVQSELQRILARSMTYVRNTRAGKPPKELDKALARLHVEYEMLHPFVDGNGRTGRMIWNLIRLHCGLPLITIKSAEKHEYYKMFQEAEMERLLKRTFGY